MSCAAEEHVIERINAASITRLPSPHFHVDNVFPEDYYNQLLQNSLDDSDFTCLGETGRVPAGSYPERFVFVPDPETLRTLPPAKQTFWQELSSWLTGPRFLQTMIDKYPNAAAIRFGDKIDQMKQFPEMMVVRDRTNYAIGPHTDAPHRFVTMLFYCPPDNSQEHLGTSLYMPIDPRFTCAGGPHYEFEQFVEVARMPFRRNSLFCFLNTNASFHGVPPIRDENIQRDMILFVARIKEPRVPFKGVADYALGTARPRRKMRDKALT